MKTTAIKALPKPWSDQERWDSAHRLYGGKVRTFARNSFRQIPYHDQCDVEQELLLVLHTCVRTYDPNRGASFNTFFQSSAKNKVISLIRHYQTHGRSAVLVSLGDDAVAAAVDLHLALTSAEELAMMRFDINAAITLCGEDVLQGGSETRRAWRRVCVV